jgi:hypothetical protein
MREIRADDIDPFDHHLSECSLAFCAGPDVQIIFVFILLAAFEQLNGF